MDHGAGRGSGCRMVGLWHWHFKLKWPFYQGRARCAASKLRVASRLGAARRLCLGPSAWGLWDSNLRTRSNGSILGSKEADAKVTSQRQLEGQTAGPRRSGRRWQPKEGARASLSEPHWVSARTSRWQAGAVLPGRPVGWGLGAGTCLGACRVVRYYARRYSRVAGRRRTPMCAQHGPEE